MEATLVGPNGRPQRAEPNRLQELRGTRPVSFVAQVLGTSVTTVRLHESRELRISAKHLDLYAKLYGVPVRELFG